VKKPDWLDCLWETIEAHKSIAFEYGVHDCCTFVAKCLDAMHGSDRLKQILGEYHDEGTAKALIASQGGLKDTVSYFLGAPSLSHHARRGDVLLVETDAGESVGICIGDTVACAGDGVVMFQRIKAKAAWCIDG
jgi:hypothetical protein